VIPASPRTAISRRTLLAAGPDERVQATKGCPRRVARIPSSFDVLLCLCYHGAPRGPVGSPKKVRYLRVSMFAEGNPIGFLAQPCRTGNAFRRARHVPAYGAIP
jgi:hypothetical protein